MKQFNDSTAKNKQGSTPQKQKSSKKKKAKKKKQPVAKNCAAKEEDQVVEEGDDDNTTLTESLHCLNNSVDNEFFNEEEEVEDFDRVIYHEYFVVFSENPFHPDCEEGDDELKINRGCSKFIICCLIRIIKTKSMTIILMKPRRTVTTQKFRLFRITTINCKARRELQILKKPKPVHYNKILYNNKQDSNNIKFMSQKSQIWLCKLKIKFLISTISVKIFRVFKLLRIFSRTLKKLTTILILCRNNNSNYSKNNSSCSYNNSCNKNNLDFWE
eukprot:TRINITY_DN8572_c0_g1_i4.p1 TRINITY_DN8572_c0_g1~~TRINITY_DN8572_c0_g1_i4.p1  ORF type:complete len:272 (+),score=20.00 TRINITY_DN8572_c0_g1_i4:33-848(+)